MSSDGFLEFLYECEEEKRGHILVLACKDDCQQDLSTRAKKELYLIGSREA